MDPAWAGVSVAIRGWLTSTVDVRIVDGGEG